MVFIAGHFHLHTYRHHPYPIPRLRVSTLGRRLGVDDGRHHADSISGRHLYSLLQRQTGEWTEDRCGVKSIASPVITDCTAPPFKASHNQPPLPLPSELSIKLLLLNYLPSWYIKHLINTYLPTHKSNRMGFNELLRTCAPASIHNPYPLIHLNPQGKTSSMKVFIWF